MKRIRIFFIGAKHAWRVCKIQLGLHLLNFGESCFLRLTGWKLDKLSPGEKGVRWIRPNTSNGFTTCMTHNAASITYAEIPQRLGAISRECKIEQANALMRTASKPSKSEL